MSFLKRITIRKAAHPTAIASLANNRKPTLYSIAKLMREINSFLVPLPVKSKTGGVNIREYAQTKKDRTKSAEDIARDRKVYVTGFYNDKGSITTTSGCHSACLVLYESLKEIEKNSGTNLDLKLGRTLIHFSSPHTILFFKLGGQLFEADPYNAKRGRISIKKIEGYPKSIKFIPPVPISAEDFRKERHTLTHNKKDLGIGAADLPPNYRTQ